MPPLTYAIGPRISGSCQETYVDGTLCENWKGEPV